MSQGPLFYLEQDWTQLHYMLILKLKLFQIIFVVGSFSFVVITFKRIKSFSAGIVSFFMMYG